MQQFFSAFLSGLAAGAGLIIAIGAQNAFVLRQGLMRRYVLAVVAVCIAGDIICICAGVAGMGALIRTNTWLLDVMRFGGALFLAAYGLLAAKRSITGGSVLSTADSSAQSLAKAVAACLAFTFLNPHVYLDTVVLLGSISTQFGDLRWYFAAGAVSASVLWFCGLGFGATLLDPIFRKPAAWRVLDACIALTMWAIAAALIISPLESSVP